MWAGGGAILLIERILVDGDGMLRGVWKVQVLHVAPHIDWCAGRELPEIDEAVGGRCGISGIEAHPAVGASWLSPLIFQCRLVLSLHDIVVLDDLLDGPVFWFIGALVRWCTTVFFVSGICLAFRLGVPFLREIVLWLFLSAGEGGHQGHGEENFAVHFIVYKK